MKIENKKWWLRTALACALGWGVATAAKADTRLDSLGTDVREVDDIDAIWLYPNELLQYKNTVDFRLNPNGNGTGAAFGGVGVAGADEWGGVIHDLGDDFGTIATYVNRHAAITNTQNSLLTLIPKGSGAVAFTPLFGSTETLVGGYTNGAYAPSSNVDVFWAHTDFLGLGDAGLHLTFGDNENDVIGGARVSSQVWGLAFGLNLGQFMSFSRSQFHIDYTEDYLTDNIKQPLTDDGVYTFKLGWLGQTDLNPNDSSRVFIDLQYDNDSLPTGFATAQQAANDLELLIGATIKHNITDKGFVNTGLEYEYDAGNNVLNNGFDSWTLVWNGSVESALTSWWTARAGLSKVLFNRTYVSTPPTSISGDNSLVGTTAGANSNVSFNAGFGFNAENWTLDLNMSIASLEGTFAAPAPGSGITIPGSIGAFTEADLRYKF